MNATRLWMIGGSVLIVAALVLGWFLAISPALAVVAANESDRRAVVEENELYAADLAKLKTEFESLPTLREELDELALEVPHTVDMPGLLRTIDAAASASGVSVTGIQPADPALFVAAVPEPLTTDSSAPVAEPTDPEAAAPEVDAGEEPAVTAAPVAGSGGVVPIHPADLTAVTAGNFYTLEVRIQIAGDLGQALAMAQNLQNSSRIFLVTGVTSQSGENPTGTIVGLVYVQKDSSASTADATTPTP